MIKMYRNALPILAIAACSACSTAYESTTRAQTTPLAFSAERPELFLAEQQAESLNRLADDMVRQSTGKGAAYGAALGCGLALVSAGSARKCVAGAVAGGGVGAVIGHEHGKRKVAQSVAKVSAQNMYSSLNTTSRKLDEIEKSLPKTLAAQDAELAQLRKERNAGTLTKDEYSDRIDQIREARSKLAKALTDSAEKASASADNLGVASLKQPELLWHIGAAKQLEDDAMSTRAQINLF